MKLPFHKKIEGDEMDVSDDRSDRIRMIVHYVLFVVFGIVTGIVAQFYCYRFVQQAKSVIMGVPIEATGLMNSPLSIFVGALIWISIYALVIIAFGCMYLLLHLIVIRKMRYGKDIEQTGLMLGVAACVIVTFICWLRLLF